MFLDLGLAWPGANGLWAGGPRQMRVEISAAFFKRRATGCTGARGKWSGVRPWVLTRPRWTTTHTHTHTHTHTIHGRAWTAADSDASVLICQVPYQVIPRGQPADYLLSVDRLVQLHGVDMLVRLQGGDGIVGEGDPAIPSRQLIGSDLVYSAGARQLTRIP